MPTSRAYSGRRFPTASELNVCIPKATPCVRIALEILRKRRPAIARMYNDSRGVCGLTEPLVVAVKFLPSQIDVAPHHGDRVRIKSIDQTGICLQRFEMVKEELERLEILP